MEEGTVIDNIDKKDEDLNMSNKAEFIGNNFDSEFHLCCIQYTYYIYIYRLY